MVTEAIQQDIDMAQAASAIRALVGEDAADEVLRRAGASSGEFASRQATMVDIYNRWDGRHQQVAAYQAPKILAERFPADRQLYPDEVQGQLAWVLQEPSRAGELKRAFGPREFDQELPCYFSEKQTDEFILADVQGAGIPLFCRKRGPHGLIRFKDELARQAHMKKHPRAMETLKTYRDLKNARDRTAAERTQVETLSLLVEQLLAERNGGAPAAAPVAQREPHFDDYKTEYTCEVCGLSSPTGAGLAAHKRAAHKE